MKPEHPTTATLRRLRAGDSVVVASRDEIFATLDDQGCLDGLPFQPEMLRHCGQTLRVAKIAHKSCDNITKTGGRRMNDAVHLEGARCDGQAHGQCMADCVFYWKLAWLRPVGYQGQATPTVGPAIHEGLLQRHTTVGKDSTTGAVRYRCQTTDLLRATQPLVWWDVRQYVRDVSSGNHSLGFMLKILAFGWFRKLVSFGVGYRYLMGGYNWVQRWGSGKPYPSANGSIAKGSPTPREVLDLKVGEWVEVKSQAEILKTITVDGFNRGMRYDMELSQYAGRRARVEKRVERIIEESTGKMLVMKTPCIQLENIFCRATCTTFRLGCPRASNTYWREIWLKRVDGP